MSELRCFIALDIPDDIQRMLATVIEDLKATRADVKWVDPGNIHLTLKFLGSVDTKKVGNVRSLIKSLNDRFTVIGSGIGSIGAFPNLSRPQVVWAGLSKGQQEISALFNELEDGLVKLDFPKDQRKFSPHLTLGRVRSGCNLRELSERIRYYALAPNDFIINEMAFFKSTLTPRGAMYEALEKVKLSR
jgi:2'-5' RNA ligase